MSGLMSSSRGGRWGRRVKWGKGGGFGVGDGRQ